MSERLKKLSTDLALSLREKVLPILGSHSGRGHFATGASGDITFEIDEIAEQHLEEYLAQHAAGVAFYSEDRGLVTPAGDPEYVLIVDPIDGTRPAMAGFESACVAVAAAPLGSGEPLFKDLLVGCVVEIKSGAKLVAVRGQGLDSDYPVVLSENVDLNKLFWAYGLRGRPVVETATVLEGLINASSVGGGTFDLGSAAYDMTRVVTGQLDAYIEPAPRMIADLPEVEPLFRKVGSGHILNNTPYDLAAAALCLSEAGAIVTDAYGEPLDQRPLLGSGPEYQLSCIACANAELHRAIIDQLDQGILNLKKTGIRKEI